MRRSTLLCGIAALLLGASETRATEAAKLVDLNTASVSELDELPGVGRLRAHAIVSQRKRKPFRHVNELRQVPGFGRKLYQLIRPLVTVGTTPVNVAAAP